MKPGRNVFRRFGFRQDREPAKNDSADVLLALTTEPDAERARQQSDTAVITFESSTSAVPTRAKPRHDIHRSISVTSVANSIFPGATSTAAENTSLSHDPLGLHLIHDSLDPSGDIIFVHGLGGSAWKTWCWNRDLKNFWPIWLAEDDELSSFRIFTFGYNSNFKGAGSNLNITDFAKRLLLDLLTFSGEEGQSKKPIGTKKIIFVVHSMGGLVVKKAYILGKQDSQYSNVISRVHGIVFLATPHRGAQYARILNNILSAAPLGAPPKAYVADLDTNSTAIQDINEQFREICGDLALVSFFETLKTQLGISKILIVEKDSAVLQYPQEISSPLHADHHTACKFRDRTDSNYRSVKNILKYWTNSIRCVEPDVSRCLASNNHAQQQTEAILGIREAAEEDLKSIRNRTMGGTCQWLIHKPDFVHWMRATGLDQRPRMFWLVGLPATGKTAIVSTVVNYLNSVGRSCQYHFFATSHQAKRTAAYCLRSIASQLASKHTAFREALVSFHAETGIAFTSQSQTFSVIWEKIFEGIIFKVDFGEPLYWVFDAIDEADPEFIFLNSLNKIQSVTPIHIFLSGRPTKVPAASAVHGPSIVPYFLSQRDTEQDIRAYVTETLRNALPGDECVQKDITNQILLKASGSFLWIKLALETLQDNWHTQEDVQKTLTEVPTGMVALYERMLKTIDTQPPRTQALAKRILTWVACAWRPLGIDELKVALEPEFTGFLKLEDTINQICGHFVSVDGKKVVLIHATARQFLLEDRDDAPAFINHRQAHEHIAISCIKYLSSGQWRRVFQPFSTSLTIQSRLQKTNRLLLAEHGHPFLGYSTCYWAYHVSRSRINTLELMQTLKTFFSSYCLSWIEAIALSSNLRYLTRSAQFLKAYAKRKSRRLTFEGVEAPTSLRECPDMDLKWIQSWAMDFIRIVGKFGPSLVLNPSSIYRDVPPFCPRASMIGQTYGQPKSGMLSVTGLPRDGWDDCLARVSVEGDGIVSKVLATEAYFITLVSSTGMITIWYSETCERARAIEIDAYVPLMALNKAGTLLATASYFSYQIWELTSGKSVHNSPKLSDAKTLEIAFGTQDSELIIGLEDGTVACLNLDKGKEVWQFSFQPPELGYQGCCPGAMALSPDYQKVAMAWRGKPPLVWHLMGHQDRMPLKPRITSATDSLCAPELLTWHPDSNSLLVLCQDTNLVEWKLYEEEQVGFNHVRPRELSISRDGNFLLTSDHTGTASVWCFPRLTLIYRLIGDGEFIRDITFSPDSQRFYDTRGSMCTVWEPEALVRPDEQDLEDHSSIGETSSASTDPVISRVENGQELITALAITSNDAYYCCGRENGSVVIHDSVSGKKLRKVYNHDSSSSVLSLAWSRSGRFIASCNDSAHILAKRLEVKDTNSWAVYPVLDIRLDEPVQQFVFSLNEMFLLISTPTTDRLYDLKTKQEILAHRLEARLSRRWMQHPSDSSLLIRIDPSQVSLYSWKELQYLRSTPLTSQIGERREKESADGLVVIWASAMKKSDMIAYGMLPVSGDQNNVTCLSHHGLHLEYLGISDTHPFATPSLLQQCRSDVAVEIKRLVGVYEDRIVFLDHDYWLCTWDLGTDVEGLKRHFFLPKDWLNSSSLQMAVISDQGLFFCPKFSDVAVVRNGIRL